MISVDMVKCPKCSGKGKVIKLRDGFMHTIAEDIICDKCYGSGVVEETNIMYINRLNRIIEEKEKEIKKLKNNLEDLEEGLTASYMIGYERAKDIFLDEINKLKNKERIS